MGHLAQAHGRALEDALAYAHSLYFGRRNVWVQHNGIAGTWRSRGPDGQRTFTPISRQAAPDYYGCIRGRFVAFDAKTEQDPTWRLPRDREHQYRTLQNLASAGALCWFAVEHRPAQVLHLLRIFVDSEWPAIHFEKPAGPHSHQTVDWTGNYGGYDWLTVVEGTWL